MSICNILRPFGIFYDHLAHFVFIWYIFLWLWYHVPKKSGNPEMSYEIIIGDKV
jgi:hypothetical protein